MANYLALANAATGNATDGSLLYRLKFRCDQAKKAGKWGTAQSREQLSREVGLTLKQVKLGTDRLRKAGYIETERHLFANKLVNHFRLTERGEAVFKAPSEWTPKGPIGRPLKGPTEWPFGGPFLLQGGPHGEDNKEDNSSGAAIADANTEGSETKTKVLGEDPEGKGGSVKAGDFLKQAKLHKKLHKPDTVSGIVDVWHEVYAANFDGMCPVFTLKAKGQLSALMKLMGHKQLTRVVKETLSNWTEFVKQVQSETGVQALPPKPSLAFLQKHVNVALAMLVVPETRKKPLPAPSGVEQKGAQLIAPALTEEPPMSYEEMLALMSDDEDDLQGGG